MAVKTLGRKEPEPLLSESHGTWPVRRGIAALRSYFLWKAAGAPGSLEEDSHRSRNEMRSILQLKR
jgi:hypothetical protein